MASQHFSFKQVTTEESFRVWVGNRRPNSDGMNGGTFSLPPLNNSVSISDAGRQAASRADDAECCKKAEDDADAITDPKLKALINLIESLTGHKIRTFRPEDLKGDKHGHAPSISGPPPQQQGWGMEYDKHTRTQETEQTTFASQGVVKTSDGKEINFNLSLSMSREFTQESNVSIRMGEAAAKKDPLVINFNGTAAQLTDTKFSFDLDSDGKNDNISFVGSGSGFLALDKNNNGSIDNGSELFGTASGNGFADLAAYDSDGNQWIDENDAIYSQLKVWSKDASGKDTISTLAERDVGALFLGNVSTLFDIKNSANDMQGQVRSTGIYLQENGNAGTLQQVDLVV